MYKVALGNYRNVRTLLQCGVGVGRFICVRTLRYGSRRHKYNYRAVVVVQCPIQHVRQFRRSGGRKYCQVGYVGKSRDAEYA